jgi:membrane protein DedA with SNARE-associated domain
MPDTQDVLAFLIQHQHWLPVLAALLAMAETTALVSILIPSTAILVALGGAVAAGVIPFLPLWIGASIGAVIGSTFSWWLGWHYGDDMLRQWPLRKHPTLAERTRAAFAKWGDGAIFAGHFIGPLRPVVFLMSGLSRIGHLRFQAFNLAGALGWAFIMPKSGELGGNALGWLWQTLTL